MENKGKETALFSLNIPLFGIAAESGSYPLTGVDLMFVTTFVGHSKFLATFSATGCQYTATIGCSHSLKETVLVAALAL
jgi:hypothetical protein